MSAMKIDGTWNDRVKSILSLTNQNEIEQALKQSSSYADRRLLIILSTSKKNQQNLLEICNTDSIPLRQRISAGKSWLKLQYDEKTISEFILEKINDRNIPRYFKDRILDYLHRLEVPKKSSTFFYDLVCRLTESSRHNQYRLDGHLVPFCVKDQIVDLLSRWSIERWEQIDSNSLFCTRLIRYQSAIVIELIRRDLNAKKNDMEQLSRFLSMNYRLLIQLIEKEPKAMGRFTIDYLYQLDKSRRFLPYFIHSKEKYLFQKIPDEMIEIYSIVGSTEPGAIKYQYGWGSDGYLLESLDLPRSLSLDRYVRLFVTLYDHCGWSSGHTIHLFQYLLKNSREHSSLSSCRKRRKWLLDIVIDKHIGREVFLEKLFEEGDEKTLELFEEFPEITTHLSLHLQSECLTKKTLSAKQRLFFLRYQSMTSKNFKEFVTLINQTSSDLHQREKNYFLFLQSALTTDDDQQINNVFQWIQQRFTNERLHIIENFLRHLTQLDHRFYSQIFTKQLQAIDSIVRLASNHLQTSSNTGQILLQLAFTLLQRMEFHHNDEEQQRIQSIACQWIKKCFEIDEKFVSPTHPISTSYPKSRQVVANLLVQDIFPRFLSHSMVDALNDSISLYLEKSWTIPSIDSFLHSFFFDHLPNSAKLQSLFHIDRHSAMISSFLQSRSTQIERVRHLLEKTDRVFFLNERVQRIALRSQQYRTLIDQLIDDDRSLNFDKLTESRETKLAMNSDVETKTIVLPGFHINILHNASHDLTGKEQQHIRKIITDDFLHKTVTNLIKMKSLRILYRLRDASDQSLQWLYEQQTFSFSPKTKVDPLEHFIICLPVRFDLTFEDLMKQFHFFQTKLNAANAKYISDALLVISRRIPDEIFLNHYLQFVRSDQFQKLGITANKEILRLLTEFASDASLIRSVIKPLWESRPHPDVRACLITTLMNFIDQLHSEEEKTMVWTILEQAADDNYLPVIQSVFLGRQGSSTRSISPSNETFQTLITRIQLKVLDHPTSMEARRWAWSNIDLNHCDYEKLMKKVKELTIGFNRESDLLWETAFTRTIASHSSSSDVIIEIIRILMSRREELDLKENDLDEQNDLLVYHRLHCILTHLTNEIPRFEMEKQVTLRSLVPTILHFEKTFAPLLATLWIKTTNNKDDFQSIITLLEENLPQDYFQTILLTLGKLIAGKHTCPFIQKLNVNEKIDLVQGFMDRTNQTLLVFDLLKDHVLNQSAVDQSLRRTLLQRMRESENLFLRQKALSYTVRWGTKKTKAPHRSKINRAPRPSSSADMDDMDFSDIFNVEQQ